MPKTLLIPGYGGSGAGHWQDWWLRRDANAELVEQASWRRPSYAAWSARLEEAIRLYPWSWLVSHSLGGTMLTRLAAERPDLPIAGALIVAPADVEHDDPDLAPLADFGPMSLAPLPFPATMVASRSDRYLPFRRARELAQAWGTELIDYGDAGHINVAAGYGPWPDGQRFLSMLQGRHPRIRATIHLAPWPEPAAHLH